MKTNATKTTICPQSPSEWRKWLTENHQHLSSIWLIYHKKHSGVPSISWSEAVDEALCFGWIDGKKQSIDADRYQQLFSQRKPDSTWSKINKEKVRLLIESHRMTPAGLAVIETAKRNGSWTLLDSVEELEVPDDLEHEFLKCEGAKDYYLELSNSKKKMILQWIVLAKRQATRIQRIRKTAEQCANRKMPV